MSDFEKLINASDLIEWIMEAYPDWCVGIVRSIIDHVEELPSVETEIIRCKECKYKQQCRKAVEHITHEPTSVTIGYKSVDFCSYGERGE